MNSQLSKAEFGMPQGSTRASLKCLTFCNYYENVSFKMRFPILFQYLLFGLLPLPALAGSAPGFDPRLLHPPLEWYSNPPLEQLKELFIGKEVILNSAGPDVLIERVDHKGHKRRHERLPEQYRGSVAVIETIDLDQSLDQLFRASDPDRGMPNAFGETHKANADFGVEPIMVTIKLPDKSEWQIRTLLSYLATQKDDSALLLAGLWSARQSVSDPLLSSAVNRIVYLDSGGFGFGLPNRRKFQQPRSSGKGQPDLPAPGSL